jgi:hypothetical protein
VRNNRYLVSLARGPFTHCIPPCLASILLAGVLPGPNAIGMMDPAIIAICGMPIGIYIGTGIDVARSPVGIPDSILTGIAAGAVQGRSIPTLS